MNIPSTHQLVMPYLMLAGAAGFAAFAEQVFGATVTMIRLREGSNQVMHSELQIGGSTIMYCDATEQWAPQTANLFVYVPNADDTYAAALAAGATVVMEPSTQDYGRTCGVKDPFGNTWWITSVL
jgi:uncharacterized glyoxalase superfamily protein PhnB